MTWALFDYGVGNLHSLRKALEAAGATTSVTQDPTALAECKVAVLPGVGAFGAVMERLAPARDVLRSRHADGLPILGVCIGQQVLFEGSEESPGVAGLGILPGTVRRLPSDAGKVPHMGWNGVSISPEPLRATPDPPRTTPDPLFDGVADGAFVYYVHSYATPPDAATIATTRYGTVFTAALRSGNTLGVQFHPEKSSTVGARIIANAVGLLEAEA